MKVTYPPPLSTPIEVSDLRLMDTWYQNLSGKLMLVHWSCQFTIVADGDSSWAYSEISDGLGTNITQQTFGFIGGTQTIQQCMIPVVILVPADWYYRVMGTVTGTGVVQKGRVIEVT